mgnify:CR=1 FL=1
MKIRHVSNVLQDEVFLVLGNMMCLKSQKNCQLAVWHLQTFLSVEQIIVN